MIELPNKDNKLLEHKFMLKSIDVFCKFFTIHVFYYVKILRVQAPKKYNLTSYYYFFIMIRPFRRVKPSFVLIDGIKIFVKYNTYRYTIFY